MRTPVGKDIRPEFPRRFVPDGADLGNPHIVASLFDRLEGEDPATIKELEEWLERWSELSAAIGQEQSVRNILFSIKQNDEKRKRAIEEFMEKIFPVVLEKSNDLEKKLIANPARKKLPKKRFGVFIKKTETSLALFRSENVPLLVELDGLSKKYQSVVGSMTVTFDGAERTLPQMNRYLEYNDATVRKSAWEGIFSRLAENRDEIEDLYDEMLALRLRVARNAGFESFRDYIFPAMNRFDYTPADCVRFQVAVEKHITPLYRKLQKARLKKMHGDKLHPWDLSHDPSGKPPLKPFDSIADLIAGCLEIFNRVDPELGKRFEFMISHDLLDLDSRKHKSPGAWCNDLSEWRLPFILQNAVGRDDDVRTLLHESGHAFHAFECRAEPLVSLREIPLEFAEVASMGMEFLGGEHLDVFYNEEDVRRAILFHFEQMIGLFAWIATVDAFQHWVYTHPGHSRAERADAWIATRERFGGIEDWSGYEEYKRFQWHRQTHIFVAPFYYIEYGIAQIGALQIWMAARKRRKTALKNYRKALALGASRSLPELFKAGGLKFGMDTKTLKPIVREIERYLKTL